MGAVTVGVDVGQRHDPTAIAVVEVEWRRGARAGEVMRDAETLPFAALGLALAGRDEAHFLTRHLERLPLGTSYPDVATRVARVVAGVVARTHATPTLYVDATGVGTPVVDVLRDAGVYATPVYFCHGDRRTVDQDGVKLGKAWLVSRLQVLLQCGQIHLPKTAEAEALARELLDYEIHVDQDANDRYGAFRVGTHDDLVTALGLAVQEEGASLPFGWYRNDPTFRREVLGSTSE